MTAENEKVEPEELQERERTASALAGQAPELAPAVDGDTKVSGAHRTFSYLEPGEIVSGRYRIIGEIGKGGMGTVYKVEQVFLHCTYALKLFDARHSSPSSLMRFQREAQAAHDLNHPNLVRVHDFGTLEDSTPFLVMDFVEGKTLATLIKTKERLSVDEAVKIFLQLCEGLSYAHEQGIVHRDIKPANIMVQPSGPMETVGEVKILDFGIAKILHENELESLPLTRTGEVFGSPLYMSPEQCHGRPVDQRSDIYSLGCSLFEALTGLPPFSGDSALSTMLKHQSDVPLSLRETRLGEQFPESLETVLSKLLAKDPESRYQSAPAVKEDLLRVLDNRKLCSSSTVSSISQKTAHPKLKASMIATAVILLLAVAGLLAWPEKQKPSESQAAITIPELQREGEILAEIRASMPSATDKYFAINSIKERNKGPWLLNFPNKSIGWIWTEAQGYSKKIPAQRDISIPSAQPLAFEPNMYGCMETAVFHAFRPDELYKLKLAHNGQAGDNVLRNISHLTGLKMLNLDSTPVTDEGLAAVAELPNLQELNVSETDVTPGGLMRLKSLNGLHCLEMGEIADAGKVLRQMQDSSLRILRVQNTRLRDEDLQIIAGKFPKLTHLFIKNNAAVSDRGIAFLENASHLVSLDVRNCSLTPGCIEHLKRIPSLRNLDISLNTWTKTKRVELEQSIPKCIINSETP